ncbi:MAG TPA: TonB-dependent receptor [Thermoanaerobaculia bacterium]|nr:TonB-dependent receptor [Thermoanaerobaculia bacterium]
MNPCGTPASRRLTWRRPRRHSRPAAGTLPAFLFAALFIAFTAHASTLIPSALTGRVTANGAPAGGVTVTVSSPALQHPRTATTSASGMYFIAALPPGEYEVTFTRTGLSALTHPVRVILGRVARADAALEVNEDGDEVTSTERTVSMGDTVAITTNFTAEQLDRMPVVRDPVGAALLAPGFLDPFNNVIDDAAVTSPGFIGEEVTEEVTIFRGGLPADVDLYADTLVAAHTRSGGEEFSLSLRDSVSGGEHLFETASGGRIVPQKLWFFGAGWAGDSDFRYGRSVRGWNAKLTGQVGAAHNFIAHHLDAKTSGASTAATSLRYTGVASQSLTFEAIALHTETDFFPMVANPLTELAGRASYVTGEHTVTAGVSHRDEEGIPSENLALFLNDRWSNGRWVVSAGVRHEQGDDESRLSPRAGITFDLRGNGRHALVATYGEYADVRFAEFVTRAASFGYIAALGQSGTARIDVLRHDTQFFTVDSIQLDARYRLFDRFEFGGNYTRSDVDFGPPAFFPKDVVNAWVTAQFAFGSHELSASILQRYSGAQDFSHSPTDLALRYAIPIRRAVLTLAGDMTNVFADDGSDAFSARFSRLWARLTF